MADEIPFCTDDQLEQAAEGVAPAEAGAEGALAAESVEVECQVAPSDVTTYDADGTTPAPIDEPLHATGDYHYVGYSTNSYDYQGGQAAIEVVNIGNLPHDDDHDQFVANRVLMTKASGSWAEIGWAEVDWHGGNADQHLYTYDTQHNQWNFYGTVNAGTTQIVRARLANGNTRLERWNPGSDAWQLLDSTPMDCGGNACRVENFTEIWTDNNTHADWNGGLSHTAAKLDTSTTDWPAWSSNYGTNVSGGNGYSICQQTTYTAFNAVRFSC